MLAGGIALPDRRREPPLSPTGGTIQAGNTATDDCDTQPATGSKGHTETRGPAAYDDQIVLFRHLDAP
ncbi:MAG: hypothetical protein AMXMBFR25_22270 [Lysobacterales bacterium]